MGDCTCYTVQKHKLLSLLKRVSLFCSRERKRSPGKEEEEPPEWRFEQFLNPMICLHDGVILLLRPESFGFFLSCANYRLCYLNLAGITKFKCERKNEKNSGRSSKMTPSYIVQMAYTSHFFENLHKNGLVRNRPCASKVDFTSSRPLGQWRDFNINC